MSRMRHLANLLVLAAVISAHAKPPSADQILRKAEAIRNPALDYAVDFTIHGVTHSDPVSERDASYSMIASGKDKTMILMRSPSSLYGALVLMADGKYWMLLPRASKTWELAAVQMQAGDIATGYLARVNLMRGFKATFGGEDDVDGEACWRLELMPEDTESRYARIVYRVAKESFLPRTIEFYGRTEKLAKSVRYLDYRKGALGLRPMRLSLESLDEWKEAGTLTFSNLRKIDPKLTAFTQEGMIVFRDAAIAAQQAARSDDIPVEALLHTPRPSPGAPAAR